MIILLGFMAAVTIGVLSVLHDCRRDEPIKVENWNPSRRKRGEK